MSLHQPIKLGNGNAYDSGPDFAVPDTRTIAAALAKLCRWNGHTDRFYSVAQHSVLVSELLFDTSGRHDLAIHGLLHDAAECVTGDIVTPIRNALGRSAHSALQDMERRFMASLYKSLRLTQPNEKDRAQVKLADQRIFMTERRDLTIEGGADALDIWPDVVPISRPIKPMQWPVAETAFLDRLKSHLPHAKQH